jgi:3D-(3,5/4)-trihydroxycyclohexane-1,2-dione acylhydrolase (decyclizing)
MTNGYESWWHVGVAEVSENQQVQEAYKEKVKNLEMARVY